MLLYDNLEDARSKLNGTIIYYDGLPAYVKGVSPNPDIEHKYVVSLNVKGRKTILHVPLEDEKLNYMKFKLGYANYSRYCYYWYRNPTKQYKQGLKFDQMHMRTSDPSIIPGMNAAIEDHFTFNNPIMDMMEGNYPNLEQVKEFLREHGYKSAAFHRLFGLSYDNIHNDFIIEHKGINIGYSNDMKNSIVLGDKFNYLREALMEAIG